MKRSLVGEKGRDVLLDVVTTKKKSPIGVTRNQAHLLGIGINGEDTRAHSVLRTLLGRCAMRRRGVSDYGMKQLEKRFSEKIEELAGDNSRLADTSAVTCLRYCVRLNTCGDGAVPFLALTLALSKKREGH